MPERAGNELSSEKSRKWDLEPEKAGNEIESRGKLCIGVKGGKNHFKPKSLLRDVFEAGMPIEGRFYIIHIFKDATSDR